MVDVVSRATADSPFASANGWGRRVFDCRCGRPVFFRNSACLACGAELGFDPELRELLPLEAVEGTGELRASGEDRSAMRYRRCANHTMAAACNWLVRTDDTCSPLCRSCRLNRTVPDLSDEANARLWHGTEVSKRRLVALLLDLGLPVRSRVCEDSASGLAFDFLRSPPGGPPVTTGHADGIITLDVEEADPSRRESRREKLGERYRTVLGHLRHEVGHYYWMRLVENSGWLDGFRKVFGDERDSYQEALQRHYGNGPPADWQTRHVSAYASAHPWEDWAETWAHYLHMLDTISTASGVGVEPAGVDAHFDLFTADVLDPSAPEDPQFLSFVNGWVVLTFALNELSRSMGHPAYYPFVLSGTAVAKLHFVHRVIAAAGGNGEARQDGTASP